MDCFTIKNLNFCYPGEDANALTDITFHVNNGEFVVLCGKSGCGKTTLLRLLKPLISPHGNKSGDILFSGKSLNDLSSNEQASSIGFVFQAPDTQIVTDTVWHELAFGLESLSVKTEEIRMRVAETASFFGMQQLFYQKTCDLSGGQKQLLNLAACMVMKPQVLLLDEPLAQLDPIAAQNFLQMLYKINRELGTTVILSEHHLEETFPLADRVLVLGDGKLIANGSPIEVGYHLHAKENDMVLSLPTPMRVYHSIPNTEPCPVTVRDGKAWLDSLKEHIKSTSFPEETPIPMPPAVVIYDAWFRYQKDTADVLRGLTLTIPQGSIYALVGGNGTGKSTTLSLMASLITPYRGSVKINGRVGMLPQNPCVLFTQKTVISDLSEMTEDKERIHTLMELCEISHVKNRHPYDLSGGEQERVGLCKVLLSDPDILLLDEPTQGLDAHLKEILARILTKLKRRGITVIMVSHDLDFCAEYADFCGMLFGGHLTGENTPRRFFSGKSFYTTAANRMARVLLPDAVTVHDICSAFQRSEKRPDVSKKDISVPPSMPIPVKKKAEKKRSLHPLLSCLILLLLIPCTVLAGRLILHDRKYYFIGLLMILETMLPFAFYFENKKPTARKLVVISALAAIAVAGRAALYMFPQFKPMLAVIIISGVAFGGEAGFFVGAISAFVSNFFIGHGAWTPWQMFAMGFIGFLAGILHQANILKKKKESLVVFGCFCAIFIYGVIMNFSDVLLVAQKPTFALFFAACLRGLPFDCVHAIATGCTLFLFAEPLLEKLERVKNKYGL